MERFRDLREDRDLRQEDIAQILEIKQQQYSRYENGNNMPYSYLKKLALFYNTSIDYILGLTNVKEPYPRRSK